MLVYFSKFFWMAWIAGVEEFDVSIQFYLFIAIGFLLCRKLAVAAQFERLCL